MKRTDTRPLTVNGQSWEYKIGRNTVAIYDPEGNRYFVKFTELQASESPKINPALILSHILTKILKDFKPRKCSACHMKKEDVVLRINPYAAELNDDNTKHFICNDCVTQMAEEI